MGIAHRLAGLAAVLSLCCGPLWAAAEDCSNGQPVELVPSGENITQKLDAARFLSMASFGPDNDMIAYLNGMTTEDWIKDQFQQKRSCHYELLLQSPDPYNRMYRMEVWWRVALTGRDQLRQRVALALSELFVVSDRPGTIPQDALAHYYDVLGYHSFGNFRDLLEAVTLHPAMGTYLSMLGNQKPDTEAGIRADENYAREVMQLFTVGLIKLNLDGTPKLNSSGQTIPTYTQAEIEGLARVFTGWNHAGNSVDSYEWPTPKWTKPMTDYSTYHDFQEKVIIGGTVVPSGGDARTDLKKALDTLFKHPNTGPFISRQLIQRLVTSNPSPAYVKRVATKFNDNGKGVRGDMKAVIRAILLDKEATAGVNQNPNFGKLREPLLVMTHLFRALEAKPNGGRYGYYWPESWIGQAPLSAPSVFNFFRPSYAPNGAVKDAQLVAPEFQMLDDASITRTYDEVMGRVSWYYKGNPYIDDPDQIMVNLESFKDQAVEDPAAMIDRLDKLFTHGQLPAEFKEELAAHLATVWDGNPGTYTWGLYPTIDAIALIVDSPYYLIFR